MSDAPSTDADEASRTTDTDRRGQGEPEGQKWLSGIVSLIGLWIAASPFVYEVSQSMRWNNVIVGLAIFLVAGYNFYRIVSDRPTSTGAMSLVVLLALWTMVSQFAIGGEFALAELGVASEGLVWSNVVSGVIGALIAAYVAYAAGRRVRTGAPAEA